MKQFLLVLFILSAGFIKSQCTITSSVTPPSCPGNCDAIVTLNLSPGCTAFPYNLSINGGSCTPTGTFVMTTSSMTFSNLCSCTGLYTVILSNSFSIPVAFTNFTIFGGVPLTIVPAAFPATCSTCCDGTVQATTIGGTSPYSYTWTPSVSTTSVANNACPGVYTVCVADSKGCTSCQTTTVNFIPLGISENEIAPVKISNTKDEIVISDIYTINTLTVYDLTGRLVYTSENSNQKEIRLNKNQFNKGVYVMSVEGARCQSKHKIIVE
jgi:hypothetical protein